MQDRATLVLVEIRYRARLVPAEDTVQKAKRAKLARTALHYLQRHRKQEEVPLRFDVVALSGPIANPDIQWFRDAFTADDFYG